MWSAALKDKLNAPSNNPTSDGGLSLEKKTGLRKNDAECTNYCVTYQSTFPDFVELSSKSEKSLRAPANRYSGVDH